MTQKALFRLLLGARRVRARPGHVINHEDGDAKRIVDDLSRILKMP
ncbi:hypothetical protein WMF28_24345 [Sorangium sp. So ce590]